MNLLLQNDLEGKIMNSFITRMFCVLSLLFFVGSVAGGEDFELQLKYNGDCKRTGPLAWPKDDWYDVGW